MIANATSLFIKSLVNGIYIGGGVDVGTLFNSMADVSAMKLARRPPRRSAPLDKVYN